jgi:hypothetical protein
LGTLITEEEDETDERKIEKRGEEKKNNLIDQDQ